MPSPFASSSVITKEAKVKRFIFPALVAIVALISCTSEYEVTPPEPEASPRTGTLVIGTDTDGRFSLSVLNGGEILSGQIVRSGQHTRLPAGA